MHSLMQAGSEVYGANNWKAAHFDDQEEKERFEKFMVRAVLCCAAELYLHGLLHAMWKDVEAVQYMQT